MSDMPIPPEDDRSRESPEIDLLTQILEVLRNSTIADSERREDPLSKFWAAYRKVSGEYDGNMLERCNGNMDIVLIFAGLFSAVNTAFIIAMQPNPIDTTNILLLQQIQISLYGPSAVQPAALSASTGYSSANIWVHVLAYASLSLSLLAAFGAVLGKQWLGYYKTNCYGHGSLEDRCKQRHRKFQMLQTWQFQNVLQSFPVLLQMSLLLFGLSIGAAMWTQQQVISIMVIATTAFGFLWHVFTIVVSVASPDCPFQTPISLAIQAILRRFRPLGDWLYLLNLCFPFSVAYAIRSMFLFSAYAIRSMFLFSAYAIRSMFLFSAYAIRSMFHRFDADQPLDGDSTITSATQWILETSTNPDVVRSAVGWVPALSKQPGMNIMSLCADVRDMFRACFDHCGYGYLMLPNNTLAFGEALIHFSWHYPDARQMLHGSTQEWSFILWVRWRTLYLPQALERCRISYNRMKETDNAELRERHQADTRSALRMAVATGIDEFTEPDDERLVWVDQFLHNMSDKEVHRIVDQLIGCLEHFCHTGDLEVVGDALLLATGIMRTQFVDLDICKKICLHITPLLSRTHYRWRCVALRVASQILDKHPSLNDGESFSEAVLMTICSPADYSIQKAGDEDEFLFTNVIDLLNFTAWPEGHDLKHSPLPEIQKHVLRVFPPPKVDNTTKYSRYCSVLIRLMGPDNHPALRDSAVQMACRTRQDQALIAAREFDESQRDTLLPELSLAMLSITDNDGHYVCLISALAKSSDWHDRLITDGHVERCITLINHHLYGMSHLYLAGFLLRIAPPGQASSCCDRITNEQWWSLIERAWDSVCLSYLPEIHCDNDIFGILVKGTETYMPQDLSKGDLESFSQVLGRALVDLGERNSEHTVISVVTGLKDIVDGRCMAAFLS